MSLRTPLLLQFNRVERRTVREGRIDGWGTAGTDGHQEMRTVGGRASSINPEPSCGYSTQHRFDFAHPIRGRVVSGDLFRDVHDEGQAIWLDESLGQQGGSEEQHC